MEQVNDKPNSLFRRIDWVTIAIFLALVVLGWFSICGASYEFGQPSFFDWSLRSGKQLVWIGCALVLAFVLLMLDDKVYDTFAYAVYAVFMLLLFITPFLATDIKGSYSWIRIGSMSIQPAEFAKCATALALSKFMCQYGYSIQRPKNFAITVGIILLPMVLIIMQKETGSALVYTAFFIVLYREGMNGSVLFAGLAAVIYFVVGLKFQDTFVNGTYTSVSEFTVLLLIWIFTVLLTQTYSKDEHTHAMRLGAYGGTTILLCYLFSRYVIPFNVGYAILAVIAASIIYLCITSLRLKQLRFLYIAVFAIASTAFFFSTDYVMNDLLEPHQQQRVKVLLGIEQDLNGAGYNVNQSKIAIGSGGLLGKGFLNGTQTKLKYVPEQDTDFIFCTVGEEKGFVGSAIVLLLYLALILRLIYLSERQTFAFGRIYGYCVTSIVLFHVFINIGMVIGLTPVIGIPLPFLSYGGSSLWGFTILLFIFLRIDAAHKS